MSISSPSSGDAITAAWGQDVADALNTQVRWTLGADATTTSTSMANLMTLAVTSGSAYTGLLIVGFSTGGTSTGIVLSFNGPSMTRGEWYVDYYNGNAGTIATQERATSFDGGSGITTTDNTNIRVAVVRFLFQPSADGTLALRWKRTGTSTTCTAFKGSGGIVSVTA